MQIRRSADAARFAERVRPWLMQREAEHNLILGLLDRLCRNDGHFGQPIYMALVEREGEVAGCAFRSPPFKLLVTRMDASAIGPLTDDVADFYTEIPAVLGPERVVARFGELWSRLRGCDFSLGMRQRIHLLERVIFPDTAAPGSLRPAVGSDVPRIGEWMEAFARDTGTFADDSRSRGAELVRSGWMYLWEDGEPRSMVAVNAETPNGARVGYVYTPPSLRGRGYATSAVATLSDRLLRAGRRFCCLYTDLSNPVSNAIYGRIGYEPVCDVVDVNFGEAS